MAKTPPCLPLCGDRSHNRRFNGDDGGIERRLRANVQLSSHAIGKNKKWCQFGDQQQRRRNPSGNRLDRRGLLNNLLTSMISGSNHPRF